MTMFRFSAFPCPVIAGLAPGKLPYFEFLRFCIERGFFRDARISFDCLWYMLYSGLATIFAAPGIADIYPFPTSGLFDKSSPLILYD